MSKTIFQRIIKNTLLKEINCVKASNKNLCVFSSYDKDSNIADYVKTLISAINISLESDIIFVTTSSTLGKKQINKIDKIVHKIIHRKNKGYDFASYYLGFYSIDIKNYETIFFINDSVFGPFFDMSKIKKKMDEKKCDIWGMTESLAINYHLQSYFLAFKKNSHTFLNSFFSKYSFEP